MALTHDKWADAAAAQCALWGLADRFPNVTVEDFCRRARAAYPEDRKDPQFKKIWLFHLSRLLWLRWGWKSPNPKLQAQLEE